MARNARAGQLRTKITILSCNRAVNENGIETEAWEKAGTMFCKWVNAHGQEVLETRRVGLEETATLTMRYTDRITPTSKIRKGDDPKLYQVISCNDVEDRHVWLEVRVSREVAAL